MLARERGLPTHAGPCALCGRNLLLCVDGARRWVLCSGAPLCSMSVHFPAALTQGALAAQSCQRCTHGAVRCAVGQGPNGVSCVSTDYHAASQWTSLDIKQCLHDLSSPRQEPPVCKLAACCSCVHSPKRESICTSRKIAWGGVVPGCWTCASGRRGCRPASCPP